MLNVIESIPAASSVFSFFIIISYTFSIHLVHVFPRTISHISL